VGKAIDLEVGYAQDEILPQAITLVWGIIRNTRIARGQIVMVFGESGHNGASV
jgi:hypothetical protein